MRCHLPVARPDMSGSDREVATELLDPCGLECLSGREILTCNVYWCLPCVHTVTVTGGNLQ